MPINHCELFCVKDQMGLEHCKVIHRVGGVGVGEGQRESKRERERKSGGKRG